MPDPLAGRYDDLAVGVLFGLAAAVVCLAAWALRRRRPGVTTPVVGLALAAAGAGGVAANGGVAATPALPWPAVAVAAGAAGALLADFDRRWRWAGLAPPLLAISAFGLYATVPDVEAAVVVLGAALPLALLGWLGPLGDRGPTAFGSLSLTDRGTRSGLPGSVRPDPPADRRPPPSLGVAGALAAAGLLVWTVAAGGGGRPGAVVGGLGCFGLLAVEPLARLLDPGRRGPLAALDPRLAPWSATAAHLLLVGVAARVVGRTETVRSALLVGALALAGALAVAVAVAQRVAYGDRTKP
jgi:hypothetical protein